MTHGMVPTGQWSPWVISRGLTLILAWISNNTIVMCGMKLRVHSQTSTVQSLKFGNGYMLSSHIYWACDYISMLRSNLIHVSKTEPCQIMCFYQYPGLAMSELSHWGRVTHICVSKVTIIGSDNGLSPGRRQDIIWTSAGILLISPHEQTSVKS